MHDLYWFLVIERIGALSLGVFAKAAFSALRFAARKTPPRHAKKPRVSGTRGLRRKEGVSFARLYGTFRFAHPGLKPWTGSPRLAALISR